MGTGLEAPRKSNSILNIGCDKTLSFAFCVTVHRYEYFDRTHVETRAEFKAENRYYVYIFLKRISSNISD